MIAERIGSTAIKPCNAAFELYFGRWPGTALGGQLSLVARNRRAAKIAALEF